MNRVRFLFDEHMPVAVIQAIVTSQPTAFVWRVGWHDAAPQIGTPDPQLLLFAEREGLLLVTYDKRTMPGHIADHLASGQHTCGVILFPDGKRLSPGVIADELLTVWGASAPDDWIDQHAYLPRPKPTRARP